MSRSAVGGYPDPSDGDRWRPWRWLFSPAKESPDRVEHCGGGRRIEIHAELEGWSTEQNGGDYSSLSITGMYQGEFEVITI